MNQLSRRRFLEFLGAAGLTSTTLGARALLAKGHQDLVFKPLKPSSLDELALAEGLHAELLIKFDDVINAAGERFGSDNDFTAFVPINEHEAYLWVNHENVYPLFVSGYKPGEKRTREQVDKEMEAVGGSILKIKRSAKAKPWQVVKLDAANRRLSAKTEIPFAAGRELAGSKSAIGTMANCSGGVTPWKTILTCEENFDEFYGDVNFASYKAGKKTYLTPSAQGWDEFYDRSPLHYGWVVEVNPATGVAKKHISLGRFAHEGATVVKAKDGRAVVYMGDDGNNRCIYKFIAAKSGTLEAGTLYVADVKNGKWLVLDIEVQPKLKEKFKDQTEVLSFAREAAKVLGGTPMDRPEGIAINPRNGDVIISLTNNSSTGNLFGSLFKLSERNNDPLAMEFKHETLLAGGPDTGFACPDNVVFDRQGNLWFTCDVSEKAMGQDSYVPFCNNSLFLVPVKGKDAGKPLRMAIAPTDAEFTGPSFSQDGKTLFVSVQHPGLRTTDLKNPTSQWPTKGDMPRSSVLAITGDLLDRLTRA